MLFIHILKQKCRLLFYCSLQVLVECGFIFADVFRDMSRIVMPFLNISLYGVFSVVPQVSTVIMFMLFSGAFCFTASLKHLEAIYMIQNLPKTCYVNHIKQVSLTFFELSSNSCPLLRSFCKRCCMNDKDIKTSF